jgi:hypothetical protein
MTQRPALSHQYRVLTKCLVGGQINVERHEGEVPLIKVGLRPSLTAVPKGQVSQAIIRAFGQLVLFLAPVHEFCCC